jgi:hypothetical protein
VGSNPTLVNIPFAFAVPTLESRERWWNGGRRIFLDCETWDLEGCVEPVLCRDLCRNPRGDLEHSAQGLWWMGDGLAILCKEVMVA